MKTITIKPKDGERYEIGYQGDHNVNKLVFDVESEGDLYLKLQLNETEYEPIPIPNKEFPITSTYTQEQCTYEAQILEKDELGDYRKNSPVFKLSLKKSIEETDNVKEVVPPNFQTAYDDMVDITNQIKEAFENGDFDGNGIVSIEKESTSGLTDTYKIIFSDGKKTKFNVTNGKGIVSIEKTNTQENVDTYTITFNDETTSTFTVTNGIDGYSPQVSVQQEVDGVTISVTDNEGTTKAKVLNGTNGEDGIDGTTPNIQIGTVTTLEPDQQATVERTGDNENPVFNFGIPKGKDGEVKDPLQFAIKETATGNPTIISDSADWRLQKLNIYGQSEQDGTTSVENPIPIISKEISEIKVTNGADLSQTVTLTEPITLRGIPVSSGGNVTIDGQQYVSDVICEKDGVIGVERNAIPFTLSSTDAIREYNLNGTNDTYLGVRVANEASKKIPQNESGWSTLPKILCNRFVGDTGANLVWIFRNDGITYHRNEFLASIRKSICEDIEAFKVWLETNEVTGLVIATPTFEPLPEEVQTQYKALKSYYPNTVIQTGAFNEVAYVADTKLYIEKKLSEISSQLTELKADTLLLGGM